MSAEGLRAAEEKMRAADVAPVAVEAFRAAYAKLARGERGLLPEDQVEPVAELPSVADLPRPADGALDGVVIVKLNGGLGTSMGLPGPKSLLPVRGDRTFLDLIVAQTLAARAHTGARLPLVLMNSFRTQADSLAALKRHPDIASDVPAEFLQSQEPKLRADDLGPVEWAADPSLEWCPPGHGDVYTALRASGTLDALRGRGYTHAFLSNADNLGATLDARIPAWMIAEGIPFVSEQCNRTPADRKGGHLVRADGRLVLRETAQVPEADTAAFEDIARHPFFNCNNIWLDLGALAGRDGPLDLPLIANEKTVDPTDPDSTPVVQLETAMGAAISVWKGARALRVARERFVPVKTTNDLLGVRSDAYVLSEDERLVVSPERSGGPLMVDLDPAVYKLLDGFDERFPHGPPSLVACERLAVRGDVSFGAGVIARGAVELAGPDRVPDGAVLQG